MPGFPQRAVRDKVGSIVCSLTQSIHFLSCLVFSKPNISISSLDFDKMKRRKNSEITDPQVEELELMSKRKKAALKMAKELI